jgi:hypothetical protein
LAQSEHPTALNQCPLYVGKADIDRYCCDVPFSGFMARVGAVVAVVVEAAGALA